MDNSICYIFGAGEYYGPAPVPEAGYVIAADGGYDYLLNNDIQADLIIGDFDSVRQPPVRSDSPGQPRVMRLPAEKDDTDMLAAIKEGLKLGCLRFHIYGGTGGRLDHTLANIQCLAYLAKLGARGWLHDRDTVITAIHDGEISFPAGCKGTLSVFSLSGISMGVYERGFKYRLDDAIMRYSRPTGVSNEFTGQPCSISVQSGTLAIIYPEDVLED